MLFKTKQRITSWCSNPKQELLHGVQKLSKNYFMVFKNQATNCFMMSKI